MKSLHKAASLFPLLALLTGLAAADGGPRRLIVKLREPAAREVETAQSPSLDVTAGSPRQGRWLAALMKDRPVRRLYPVHAGMVRLKKSGLSDDQIADRFYARSPRRSRRSRRPPTPVLTRSYVLDMDGASDAQFRDTLDALQRDPQVEYAHQEVIYKAQFVPNDTYFASTGSWGQPYKDLYGVHKTSCPAAWDISQGAGVVVAVVDTGVDRTHPELVNQMWSNPGEIPGNGVDDDGNGYVDDMWGYDFTTCVNYGTTCVAKPADNDPSDAFGHGTHVSGTIAAEGNNGQGIIGVAPKSKIMAVRGLADDGYGSSFSLANALIYAADNGAEVINNSWGGSGVDPTIDAAVNYAHALGATIVASAGNSSADAAGFHPAGSPNVITVSALDANDQLAWFSNWGTKIDVGAPGGGDAAAGVVQADRAILSLKSAVISSGMTGSGALVVGGQYVRQMGTSMAAPHVSGVAALILSQHPEYTNEQVRLVLRRSADDVGAPGKDINSGYGRINAWRAMNEPTPLPDTTPPSVVILSPAPGQSVSGAFTVQGTAADDVLLAQVTVQVDGGAKNAASGTAAWSYALNASTLGSGSHTITVQATDDSGNTGSASVQVTVPASPGLASFNASFRAPFCASTGSVCQTGTLVNGRAAVTGGAEPNQPNTLNNSCADGTAGTFHADESLDALSVTSLDGAALSPGKQARIDATVWAYSSFSSDFLDLYVATSTLAPAWTYLATLTPSKAGAQVLSTTATLPSAGSVQVLRGNFRYVGSAGSCTAGAYDDRDDLAFAVQNSSADTTPPVITAVSTTSVSNTDAVILWTTNEPSSTQVQYGLTTAYGLASAFNPSPATSHTALLTGLTGLTTYHYRALSTDAAGNMGVSGDFTFVTRDAPPQVSISSPAFNAQVSGVITVTGTASDDVGVAKVEVSLSNNGYSLASGTTTWTGQLNTAAFGNGGHAVIARVTDVNGNFTSANVTVQVNNPLPAVSISSPAPGGTVSGPFTVSGTASDDAGVDRVLLFVDNGGFITASGTSSWTVPLNASSLSIGTHTLRAVAFDLGQNQSAPSIITINAAQDDTTPPTVALSAPANDSTQRDSVQFVATASDTISGVNNVVFRVYNQMFPGPAVFVATVTAPPYQATWDASAAPNAAYRVEVAATDNKGNQGMDFIFHSFILDNDVYPPTVALSAPANGSTQRDTVQFVATASDTISGVNNVVFRVYNQMFPGPAVFVATVTAPPYQATWDASAAPNAAYRVEVAATDNKGNQGMDFIFHSFILDNDVYPPTVALSAPANDSTQRDSVQFVATASDTISGVNNVVFRVYNQMFPGPAVFVATVTAPPYQATWDASAAPNAAYRVEVAATDNKGNQGMDFIFHSFILDNDVYPPTVALSAPANDSTQRDSVQFVATASDTISGVNNVVFRVYNQMFPGPAVFVATVTAPPYQATWDASAAPNATYRVEVAATDNEGNTGFDFTPHNFVLDNDAYPPTVNITAPTLMQVVHDTVDLVATASDTISGVSNVVFKVYNQVFPGPAVFVATVTAPPYQVSWNTASSPNGQYRLDVVATDGKGNAGFASVPQFTLTNDVMPPTVSLTSPAAGALLQGAVSLAASASDDTGVAQVVFAADGVVLSTDTAAPYQGSWDTLPVANGTHTLTATAYDAFGHAAQSSETVSVSNPDVTAPAVSMTAPLDGANVGGTVSLSASAADAGTPTVPASGVAGVQFKLDGADLGPEVTASPYQTAWNSAASANGAHVLTAVARDFAGNASTAASVAVTLFNDGTPPTVSLSSPAANALLAGTASIAANASDNAAVQSVVFRADGVVLSTDTAAPYQSSWNTLSVANGTHTLTATAYDAAGLSAAASVQVRVANPDATPPSVSFTAPTAGAEVAGSSVTLTAAASDPGTPTVPASGVAGVQFKLDGANLGAERTSAPYTLVWNSTATANGSHVLLASARDGAGNVSISSITVTVNNLAVKVNFQPAAAALPSGYLKDSGAAFANRGNGFSYGWNAANNTAIDRNSSLSPDQRYDTRILTQMGGTFRWEIALAAGRYRVHVVAGDAGAFNSVYKFNAEGVLAVNGTPTSANRWIQGTVDVDVTDGRLTLSNASGASNNKLCFVDITRLGPAGSALAVQPLSSDEPLGSSAEPLSGSKAREKFLSPGLADGINDAAVFGPDAQNITIVDVNGRLIYQAARASAADPLAWNARDERGDIVPSGAYVVRIVENGGKAVYQTLVVVK